MGEIVARQFRPFSFSLAKRCRVKAGIAFKSDGPVPSCLARRPRTASIEEADFLLTKTRRAAIHARDRGLCFYCLTQLTPRTRCLDHVIPQARRGKNSYRNLVSCCTECNTQKGETAAEDFLRTLCRQRRITSAELAERLRKLDALAAGQIRPDLPTPQSNARARKPSRTYERFPVWSQSFPPKPHAPRTS